MKRGWAGEKQNGVCKVAVAELYAGKSSEQVHEIIVMADVSMGNLQT